MPPALQRRACPSLRSSEAQRQARVRVCSRRTTQAADQARPCAATRVPCRSVSDAAPCCALASQCRVHPALAVPGRRAPPRTCWTTGSALFLVARGAPSSASGSNGHDRRALRGWAGSGARPGRRCADGVRHGGAPARGAAQLLVRRRGGPPQPCARVRALRRPGTRSKRSASSVAERSTPAGVPAEVQVPEVNGRCRHVKGGRGR